MNNNGYQKIHFNKSGNSNLLVSKMYWSEKYQNNLIVSCYVQERKFYIFNGIGGEIIYESDIIKGTKLNSLKQKAKEALRELGVNFIELTLQI